MKRVYCFIRHHFLFPDHLFTAPAKHLATFNIQSFLAWFLLQIGSVCSATGIRIAIWWTCGIVLEGIEDELAETRESFGAHAWLVGQVSSVCPKIIQLVHEGRFHSNFIPYLDTETFSIVIHIDFGGGFFSSVSTHILSYVCLSP